MMFRTQAVPFYCLFLRNPVLLSTSDVVVSAKMHNTKVNRFIYSICAAVTTILNQGWKNHFLYSNLTLNLLLHVLI